MHTWVCELQGDDAVAAKSPFVKLEGIEDSKLDEDIKVASGVTTLRVKGGEIVSGRLKVPKGAKIDYGKVEARGPEKKAGESKGKERRKEKTDSRNLRDIFVHDIIEIPSPTTKYTLADDHFNNGWDFFENGGKNTKMDRKIVMSEGGTSLRLKDRKGIAMVDSRTCDANAFFKLKAVFFYNSRKVEKDEGFCLDYCLENCEDDRRSSWIEKKCFVNDSTAWDRKSKWLKASVEWDASTISSIKLRIRTAFKEKKKKGRIYIDNFLFEGETPNDVLFEGNTTPPTKSPTKEPSNAPSSVMLTGPPSVQPTVSKFTALDDIIGSYYFPEHQFGADEYAALEFLAKTEQVPDDPNTAE
jgi:hypothetical protein